MIMVSGENGTGGVQMMGAKGYNPTAHGRRGEVSTKAHSKKLESGEMSIMSVRGSCKAQGRTHTQNETCTSGSSVMTLPTGKTKRRGARI